MQPTTEIDGTGSGEEGDPCIPLQSSRLQSPTCLQSPQRLKLETNPGMASSLSGLSHWADGFWDGQLAQLPHIRHWIKGDLAEEEIQEPVYVACEGFEKENVC